MEYFAAVAERKHVRRAAEQLGMSQSALSKCLRRIEDSVGAKIVMRTPKGVELTPVGSAVLAHIRSLRLAHEDIAREVADLSHGRAGHVRIGISPGFGEGVVGQAGSFLLKEAPKVTLKVKVLTPAELVPAVANGELDLALTNTPDALPANMTREHLIDDEIVVHSAVDHRLAGRRRIMLADLAQERWTAHIGSFSWEALRRGFSEWNLTPPRIALESDSIPVRFHAITSCGLLGFTSRRVVRDAAPRFRFAELHVKAFSYARHLGLFHRGNAYLSPAARRFVELLKTATKGIAAEKC